MGRIDKTILNICNSISFENWVLELKNKGIITTGKYRSILRGEYKEDKELREDYESIMNVDKEICDLKSTLVAVENELSKTLSKKENIENKVKDRKR